MGKLVCFLILIISSFILKAQECSIKLAGVVKNENQVSLSGATIILNKKITVANEKGHFEYTNLCPAQYQIEVSYVGYQKYTSTLYISNTETLSIVLYSEDQNLNELIITDKQDPIEENAIFSKLSNYSLRQSLDKPFGELLRELPGVNTIQTGPTIFKPVIHGLHSQRILILNNGIRQEGQNWGAEHAPEIDPFMATNIIVVKDGAAIKYGGDALGGVILVNPENLPTEETLAGQIHLIGTSNNRSGICSGFLEGGIKKWKGLGWRAQGTLKKAGDSRSPNYILSNTGTEEQDASLSVGYHKKNKGIHLFYSLYNTSIGILRGISVTTTEDLMNAMERTPPLYTQNFTYTIQSPKQWVQHHLVKIDAHIRKKKNHSTLQYSYQNNRRQEYDFRRGKLNEIPGLDFQLNTHLVNYDCERIHTEQFQSCWGGSLLYQINSKVDGTQTIPFIPNFDHYNWAIFALEKWNLKKWLLELGLRYDFKKYDIAGFDYSNILYKSSLQFNSFSGIFSGKRKTGSIGTISGSISTAWRPPNVAELYSIGTHQSAAAIEYGLLVDEQTTRIKNTVTSVSSEQSVKLMTAYKLEHTKSLVEITGYANYIFNYVYLRPTGITQDMRGVFPYFRYTQTDASFIGIDISGQHLIFRKIMILGKYSWLQASDIKQTDFLVSIPSNRGDIGLRYQSAVTNKIRWNIQGRYSYVSFQNRAPQVISPSKIIEAQKQGIDWTKSHPRNFDFKAAPDPYGLLGIRIGAIFKLKKTAIDAQLSIENLTDEVYREYTNRLRYFAEDIGRNVTFSLRYTF